MIVLTLSFTTTIYALGEGDTIGYTASHVGEDELPIFKGTGSASDFTGVCAQVATPLLSSGNATVDSKIPNSSKETMMIYDIVYNKGWLENPKRDSTAKEELGLSYDTVQTLGSLVVAASQISHSGETAFREYYINGVHQIPVTVDAMLDWYHNYDVSSVTVPSSFELYYMDAGEGNQNFTFWRFVPNGKLRIKKVSANLEITG